MGGLLLLIFLKILSMCHGQGCNETFERYFGYRLFGNIMQDLVLKNFTVNNANGTFKTCRQGCMDDQKCQGFAVDFKSERCWIYGTFYDNEAKFLRMQLEEWPASVLWRRACLKTPPANCTYLWHYDVWPGYSMRADKVDRFQPVASIEQCQEACNSEKMFQCRSAMYNYVTRTCHLSRYDRRSFQAYFKRGMAQEIYLENQCSNGVTTGCEFSAEESSAPAFSINSMKTENAEACERLCLHNQEFVCRSYAYTPSTKQCKFGPDDALSVGRLDENKTTSGIERVAHFERNECTNVQVTCGLDQIVATFRADRAFDGRIVSMRAPKTCNFDVKQQFEFNVTFSLEQKSNCGIMDEEHNAVSAMIMMQYHDMVITARDRALKLVCKYELTNRTVSNFVELGERGPTTNATLVTGGGPLPEAFMRIVNGEGQTVTTAEIGQTLYAEVTLKEPGGKPTLGNQSEYSLFVNNCEALDDGQSVLLVDDAGCPTDTTLFEAFHPMQSGNYKTLRAAFQGFRFQTKRRVNINCNVNFCFRICQPALCSDKSGRRIMSLGRRRRRVDAETFTDAGDGEEILGRVRVQSGFDVVDSRNIPVLSEGKSEFVASSKLKPLLGITLVGSSDPKSASRNYWPAATACVVIISVMCGVALVFYCVRKKKAGGKRREVM